MTLPVWVQRNAVIVKLRDHQVPRTAHWRRCNRTPVLNVQLNPGGHSQRPRALISRAFIKTIITVVSVCSFFIFIAELKVQFAGRSCIRNMNRLVQNVLNSCQQIGRKGNTDLSMIVSLVAVDRVDISTRGEAVTSPLDTTTRVDGDGIAGLKCDTWVFRRSLLRVWLIDSHYSINPCWRSRSRNDVISRRRRRRWRRAFASALPFWTPRGCRAAPLLGPG